ncbi:MAG TPA: hypothetical protein VJQ09_05210 [Candidatus Limnocylindria bacterium]|nr:hypothetical protein [Candidatus Limnocylindria bacterium]
MAKKKRAIREAEKRQAEFVAQQRRLTRARTVVGLLAFVPLAASFTCGSGTPLEILCAWSRDIWLLIWAGLFGSFLGLTIRLVIERRRFKRGTADGRTA